MIEILPIDPDATVEAVRRQLAQLRNEQVALVLPQGWTELDNVARMRLLQRQAQIQRCHLAIVTRDETTRNAARQLGIPVFFHSEEVSQRRWRMHPRLPLIHPRNPAASLPEPPPWRKLQGQETEVVEQMVQPTAYQARQKRILAETAYRQSLPDWMRLVGIVAVFSLIALFLALFALYVLPAATITLAPGRAPVKAVVELTANPNLTEADLETNELPARFIETSIEQTGSQATTGTQQKPVDKARGAVVFSNLGSAQVFIPAGSIVSTSASTPVQFQTTADTGLEGRIGARATVPVEAVLPGVEGNVPANRINTVEGALRYRVGVSNPDGTGGGGSQLARVVTQKDRDDLLEQMKAQAEAKAYDVLKGQLKPGEWLPPESVQTLVAAQPAYSQFNDEQADVLTLTLRSLVRGVAVDEATTRKILFTATQGHIPQAGKLIADSMTLQRSSDASVVGDNVEFTVTVNAQYIVPIDPAEVRNLAAGRQPGVAIAALQKRWPLVRTPEIYQDPAWLTTLPALSNRIQVRLDYEEEGPK